MPRYPGGSEAFHEFINSNIRYPQEAQEAGVQGFVIVQYDVNDNGDVSNIRVIRKLGYGCDEEATRVIGMLHFEKVKNRGVRVKITRKTRINFHPPSLTINYSTSPEKPGKKTTPSPEDPESGPAPYHYTLDW